ncbi:hypothetical protein EEL51_14010 [Muribaculaceae bacterium Isolate-110 (HZI)]|mgnify:FL=1|nr:hypothetical protein EEL51_14010 [Muribaculaceae bacterium Isolate-110 (HZI)]
MATMNSKGIGDSAYNRQAGAKSNNAAIAVMQQMLQERCIVEPTFAIKMANPSKSMEGAVNHLCRTIQKSGLCVVDEKTVENILVDYFDEANIEDGGTPINCNIVVSKPELTEEDKAELKEQAMEQFKQERLRELRRQSQPKAQPKPTATAPKAGAEIDSIPNLFDEL